MQSTTSFRQFVCEKRLWKEMLNSAWVGAVVSPAVSFLLSGGFDNPKKVIGPWLEHWPSYLFYLPVIGVVWSCVITFMAMWQRYNLIPLLPSRNGFVGFLYVSISGFVTGYVTLALIWAICQYVVGVRTFDGELQSRLVFAGLLGFVFGMMFASFYGRELELKRAEALNRDLERLKMNAQLMNLNMRIRPHFFFNALNTLASLIDKDVEQAQEFLLELSDLFRLSFAMGHKGPFCEWRDEKALLTQYLVLEKKRFGEKLEWQFEDEAPADASFPSFFLQPLFENAVHHGVAKCKAGGTITCKVAVKNGQWHIEISNPWPGDRETEELEKPGHALALIRERAQLLGGDLGVNGTDDVFRVNLSFLAHTDKGELSADLAPS